jgi:TonB-dependent SusC/RagA subfamily outer membrane receptor
MEQRILKGFLFFLLWMPVFSAMAQFSEVNGRVIGQNGQPLAGVTVKIVSKNVSSVTSDLGTYNIKAVKGDRLEFTYVGYESEQFIVTSEKVDVELTPKSNELNAVVVTALGIRKEKRKLGYAIQDLKGDELTTARETNVVNQLAGKVAGLTVVGSNSGIGGSARVSIRGERSVDLNKNQPLYVIDGVPVSNAITGASGRGNLEVDFGNGAGFINPDDIESLSVLKGPAASALYGSRAANGVILIKTKSGRKSKGIGVEISSNFTTETALKLPEYQKVYGQGNGNGGAFAFVNGAGAGQTDGTDEGWGPAFNGQSYPQFNSPRTLNGQQIPFTGGDLNAPAGSVITSTP